MATAHMLLQVERTVGHKPTLRTGGGRAKVGIRPMDMRDQALLRDTQTTVRTVDLWSRRLPNHFRDGNKNFPIINTGDRTGVGVVGVGTSFCGQIPPPLYYSAPCP